MSQLIEKYRRLKDELESLKQRRLSLSERAKLRKEELKKLLDDLKREYNIKDERDLVKKIDVLEKSIEDRIALIQKKLESFSSVVDEEAL